MGLHEKVSDWRLHDLRRTMATGMARLGVGIHVVEKLLNHQSGTFGGIVGVYQKFEFADEKREAMEKWGALKWGINQTWILSFFSRPNPV